MYSAVILFSVIFVLTYKRAKTINSAVIAVSTAVGDAAT